jgi:hypothetical protein
VHRRKTGRRREESSGLRIYYCWQAKPVEVVIGVGTASERMWQNRLFWKNHERTNVSVPKKTKTGEWERDSGAFSTSGKFTRASAPPSVKIKSNQKDN